MWDHGANECVPFQQSSQLSYVASSGSSLGLFRYFVLPKRTFSCARNIFFSFENILLFTYFCMLYEYHIICYCCFLPRLPHPRLSVLNQAGMLFVMFVATLEEEASVCACIRSMLCRLNFKYSM